jgi:hypothetical protein
MLCHFRIAVIARTACSLAALVLLAPSATLAEPIFFGPTPYLSSADSPFDLSGLGATMFLEDFEDGELNTPGVSFLMGTIQVNSPGPFTDSVDADDGVIDGSGTAGRSARSATGRCVDTIPPHCWSTVSFDFDANILSGFPTAIGIVWTDGFSMDDVAIDVFGSNSESLGALVGRGFADLSNSGETSEDRFFGVVYPDGISSIAFGAHGEIGAFIEFDHLQYGFYVPEPNSFYLTLLAILLSHQFLDRHGIRRHHSNHACKD